MTEETDYNIKENFTQTLNYWIDVTIQVAIKYDTFNWCWHLLQVHSLASGDTRLKAKDMTEINQQLQEIIKNINTNESVTESGAVVQKVLNRQTLLKLLKIQTDFFNKLHNAGMLLSGRKGRPELAALG